jgi:hypothetical protein
MSLKAFNMHAVERVEHTRTRRRPVIKGTDAYVATGDTETYNYSGPWDEMLARFNALEGTLARRVEATITRSADGGWADLSVVFSSYIPGSEATNGDPDGAAPGGSRGNPQYERSSSEAAVALLLHPKFATVSDEVAQAATQMMNGAAATDRFDDNRTLGDVVQGANEELFSLVSRGVHEVLVQRVQLTARYMAQQPPTTPAMTIQTPPGPLAAVQAGYDWLYLGATQSYSNGELWVTETYKLSGPGGWAKELY